MNFGNIIHPQEIIDKNGSTKQKKETYRKGIAHVTTRYEIRTRVRNETEELAEYIKLQREHKGQSIEFRVEKKNDPAKDYYHVISCWEE
jgi:hypothetical protein